MTIDCLGRDNDQFGTVPYGESLTVQADAVDADINVIVARFGITGQPPQELPFVTNVDLSEAPDTYQGALDILERARESFNSLPASTRSKFSNDPGQFMDFCSDPKNIDEMRKMGLAVPKAAEPPPAPPPGTVVAPGTSGAV
ncbi:MAG: internal scaffolding protein [Microviridae sp.]|nr:MAG: internal scaffolding protein [Microviridae sp.]